MASHTLAPFPPELLAAKKQIREQARAYGLDFFPVIYEMCDYEQMNLLLFDGAQQSAILFEALADVRCDGVQQPVHWLANQAGGLLTKHAGSGRVSEPYHPITI